MGASCFEPKTQKRKSFNIRTTKSKFFEDNDTPFNSENVEYIKKIALYLALYVFAPDFFGTISGVIFNIDLEVEINMIDYLFVVIILAIAYIFKYGYEIQLDSKGRIYGDSNE